MGIWMVDSNPFICNADERCPLRSIAADPLFLPLAKMQIESTISTKTPPYWVVFLSWYGYLDGGFEPIYMQRGRALPAALHRSGFFIFALGKNANRIHHKYKDTTQ